MSKQKYTIENFASTVMILILIGFIATTGLNQLISENSSARQARANAITWQRLEQQQARFEVRQARATQLFNGIKFALLFLLNASLILAFIGLAGYLAYKLAILARKSTQAYFEWSEGAKHELKLEREYTKRLKYQYAPDKGLFQGLTLSGNLTYAPRTTDNHALNTSYTPHFKQGKSTPLELPEGSSSGANFAPVIQMPTFSDMLALPTPQNMLALGYDTNASPVYMPITSQVISGISGSGKTSTLTALATQLQQQNAQIVLV